MRGLIRCAAAFLIGLALAGGGSGCVALVAAAGAGAGAYYYQGASRGSIAAEPGEVIDAAATVFEDLEIHVTDGPTSDATEGQITGRTAGDTRVHVAAVRDGENVSRVTVRYGRMGDQQRSNMIFSRIQEELE